jgi:hypothetical protein
MGSGFFQVAQRQVPPFSAHSHPSVQNRSTLQLIYHLDLEKVATTFPAMIRGKRKLHDHIIANLTHITASFRRFATMGGEISHCFLSEPHSAGL